MSRSSWRALAATAALVLAAGAGAARASDHLDTSSVVEDPRADIGDLYAWVSPDGERLNLAMTLVGQVLSPDLDYVFRIDSAPAYGPAGATRTITCRFPSDAQAACRLDQLDEAVGDPRPDRGLASRQGRFRVFAGPRDDPFFNNVRGTRAAYNVAAAALAAGAPADGAGCPRFDAATVTEIQSQWGRTDGGPAGDFLQGWTPTAIVISVDLEAVMTGGPMLAVWAATETAERRWDRAGRPLTANALLAPLAAEASLALKEAFNAATPATGDRFLSDIEASLGFYDGLDGECGDQVLADPQGGVSRYLRLAAVLADDRLWVNTEARDCAQFFAVELAALAERADLRLDCGGRSPAYGAANAFRSLLMNGRLGGTIDGLSQDARDPSAKFPFLAPPQAPVRGS